MVRESIPRISEGFLKKAIPEKIFITENINRQAWGFTWQKRLWSAWDIGLRQKASMGSTAGFR